VDEEPPLVTLFLCGDVMTGRGVDQVLPHPGDPTLHEPSAASALDYVELAESRTAPIPRPVDTAYVWGDALAESARVAPDVRVVNLETAVTTSDAHWPTKGIHYRMHPGNVPCLTAARIDCCVLANNHVLDWGYAGLRETLDALRGASIKTAGAGADVAEAAAPAVMEIADKGRVAVFAFGSGTSGIPREWAAAPDRPGVNLLPDLSDATVRAIAHRVGPVKRPGTVVVASVHWGSNWGYHVPRSERAFARRLIDEAGVDLVHGHSSHHPKGIEVYRDRLILYGCGDFLNDYEGIEGYEEFRGDLGLMYFPAVDPGTGRLVRLAMTPTRVRRFRVTRASSDEAQWLRDVLSREGRRFGTRARLNADGTLALEWTPARR
jgi:poly-gamma-glutamate synthesis protein (capsule biosynthesis protein)